jgi:endonuclease/exonuclease/phosphatase family metal-dependent hydrolase
MRIITWNCRKGGWRNEKNKESLIKKLNPDIVIVQECENIGKNDSKNIWIKDPNGKGIGVFSYSDYTFEIHKDYDKSFKHVVPINVKGKNNFLLFAVWTKRIRNRPEIEQAWKAMNHYKHLLNGPIIISGDFNWNKIWDDEFMNMVELLKEKIILSTYHAFYKKEDFGKETRYTEFHNNGDHYHVDYCFASSDFLSKLHSVEVGKYSKWVKPRYSDHVPVIVTFSV